MELTDKDIIKFVKDIREFDRNQPLSGRLIYLDVGDWDNPKCGLYSYDHSEIDELLVKLADLSITQKIVKVSRDIGTVPGIIDVNITESDNGQTNIDAEFMDACVEYLKREVECGQFE